jgi:hypothetical protein
MRHFFRRPLKIGFLRCSRLQASDEATISITIQPVNDGVSELLIRSLCWLRATMAVAGRCCLFLTHSAAVPCAAPVASDANVLLLTEDELVIELVGSDTENDTLKSFVLTPPNIGFLKQVRNRKMSSSSCIRMLEWAMTTVCGRRFCERAVIPINLTCVSRSQICL